MIAPPTDSPTLRELAGLALLSVATAAVALAVGYFPTHAVAGPEGVPAMVWGVGIALVASLVGLVPPLVVRRRGPQGRALGLLAGTAVRFLVMLVLLLIALLGHGAAKLPLALWAVIAYLLLLAADTIGVALVNRRAQRWSSP